MACPILSAYEEDWPFAILFFPLGFQIVDPEGRDVPELLDDRRQMLADIVHLLFRIVNGEAETDRTVGRRERNTHGSEHVGRLQGTGSAGRP